MSSSTTYGEFFPTTYGDPGWVAPDLLDSDEGPTGPARPRFEGLLPASPANPRWARPALALLLLGTAALYLINLGASGNANSFYAAAVQAGTLSWKAWFFGSLDASNFITVDKPPGALWVMGLSGRIFGFNSWSMLVPQALMGVAAVALLYATVRRWFGVPAALIAGAVLALTPVAVLMFRFNNPDALMVLLLVVGAYCITRALERGSLKWMVLLGVTVGFGFLTKGLQPFTVVPAFAFAYLVAAPIGLGRRIVHVLLSGVAVVVSAGWWVVAVLLWPVASRPYIGGSTTNSPLELAFGYNGLGRLTGNEGGGGTGGAAGFGGGGGGFGGATGLGRLFNSEMGGEISWLLPAALIATVALAALAVVARRAGTDTRRLYGATILWGGWLVVTGAVFSFASGTIHGYYTVQLAPAIAALVGIGAVVAWRLRHEVAARVILAGATVVTGGWSFQLLGRSPDYYPWLRWSVLIVAVAAAVAVLAAPQVTRLFVRRVRVLTGAVVAAVAIVGLGGSVAYAGTTASTAHTGGTPSPGPAVTGAGFGGQRGGFGGGMPTGGTGEFAGRGGAIPGGMGGMPTGGMGGVPTGGTGVVPTGGTGGAAMFGGGGATADSAVVALLTGTTSRWAAATTGSQTASALELASGGKAVMAIGGFSGSDPAPTLAQFQAWVNAGDIGYYIGGGGMGRGGNSEIATWVAAHYTAQTVGGSTVYDLSKAAS